MAGRLFKYLVSEMGVVVEELSLGLTPVFKVCIQSDVHDNADSHQTDQDARNDRV